MNSEQAAAAELRDRLAGEPGDRRARLVLDLVRARTAAVLGTASAAAVRADRPFRSLGVTQDLRERLRRELSDAAGLALPSTLLFDHPTPAAVARYLLERITGDQASAVARSAPVDPARSSCRSRRTCSTSSCRPTRRSRPDGRPPVGRRRPTSGR